VATASITGSWASDDGGEIEMALPERFRLTGPMRQAIKAIPGLLVEEL